MKIISLNDIVDCNKILKEKDLEYKVHIRDACGRQSCWIEALGKKAEGMAVTVEDALYQVLEDFFAERGIVLVYDEDKVNFWVDQKGR